MLDSFYDALKGERWTWYFEGLGKTLLISLGAITLGCILGIIVSLIKYTNKKYSKMKIPSYICDIYLAIFRGTPVYVQLLIMYLIVLVSVPSMWVAILTFGINSGAYVAEIIRGGLEGVDDGQLEAGNSLGLSNLQVLISIVLPQAIRRALPPFCNEFIALIKETSIVSFIAVTDLYKSFKQLGDPTYNYTMPYLMLALTYLIMVLLISWGVRALEAKMKKSER